MSTCGVSEYVFVCELVYVGVWNIIKGGTVSIVKYNTNTSLLLLTMLWTKIHFAVV